MAINVADNFSYKGGKPLDARVKYDTIAAMVAVPAADLYDGCMAYVTATKLNYQYDSSNTADPTLGKWREFQTGGGGHEILDVEDTALTQREKLKFGNGLTASDNSEDEQTEVEVDVMSSEDMDDIVTPLPSVSARYHKYSTEEQVVGEWIDGKPIYQITFEMTVSVDTDKTFKEVSKDISSLNIESLVKVEGDVNNVTSLPLVLWSGDTTYLVRVYRNASLNTMVLSSNRKMNDGNAVRITIQYTKTSD